MELSIIIVTYNSEDVIGACLRSIYENSKGLAFEVIVVDNVSSDKTVEIIEKSYPQVDLFKSEENRGFSSGVNYGIKRSKGRNILLLNPDTIILGQAVKKCLSALENDKENGIAGGQLLYPNYRSQASFGNFPSSLTEFLQATFLYKLLPFGRYVPYNIFTKYWFVKELEPDWVSGGFMMMKKEVVEKVGLFDEKYFLYLEDVDYCQRAKEAGFRILFYPKARIIHHHMESSKKDHAKVVLSEINSLKHYFKKNKLDTTWLEFFIYLRVYTRIAGYFFSSAFSKRHKKMLNAYLRALTKIDI